MANGGGPGHGHTKPAAKKSAVKRETGAGKTKKSAPGQGPKTKAVPKARPKNND